MKNGVVDEVMYSNRNQLQTVAGRQASRVNRKSKGDLNKYDGLLGRVDEYGIVNIQNIIIGDDMDEED